MCEVLCAIVLHVPNMIDIFVGKTTIFLANNTKGRAHNLHVDYTTALDWTIADLICSKLSYITHGDLSVVRIHSQRWVLTLSRSTYDL